MITKLTSYQRDQLKVYRDKWINIGLSTDNPSKEEITKIIDNVYIHLLKRKTVPIIITQSPREAWKAVCLYKYLIFKSKNKLKNYDKNKVRFEVRNEVWNKVRNEVWNKVRNEV